MTRALAVLALLTACSTDFVSPEDPRCTIEVLETAESYEINRWQIEHCESVRIIIVHFEGTVP